MRDRRGFALIGALWLLVVLSAVGLELSLAARSRRAVALNAAERTRAAWVARAGLETARARLTRLVMERTAGTRDAWWNAGALLADSEAMDGGTFRARVRDANAALHLNRAAEHELRLLFNALRIDDGDADRLAQSILDWRDADDLHRARGAEREAYLEAHALVLPRNGPFRSVPELLDVRGMTRELYDRIEPYVTVIGTGRVNVNAAPRPVLLALPGMTDHAVALIEQRRRRGESLAGLNELTEALPAPARAALRRAMPELLLLTTFETRELDVVSTGWADDPRVTVRASALLVQSQGSVFTFGVVVE